MNGMLQMRAGPAHRHRLRSPVTRSIPPTSSWWVARIETFPEHPLGTPGANGSAGPARTLEWATGQVLTPTRKRGAY